VLIRRSRGSPPRSLTVVLAPDAAAPIPRLRAAQRADLSSRVPRLPHTAACACAPALHRLSWEHQTPRTCAEDACHQSCQAGGPVRFRRWGIDEPSRPVCSAQRYGPRVKPRVLSAARCGCAPVPGSATVSGSAGRPLGVGNACVFDGLTPLPGVHAPRRLSREYCTARSSAEMMLAISRHGRWPHGPGRRAGRPATSQGAGWDWSAAIEAFLNAAPNGQDWSATIEAFLNAAPNISRAVATATTLLGRVASPERADLQRGAITFKCAWHV
jgi:hypothetical protein